MPLTGQITGSLVASVSFAERLGIETGCTDVLHPTLWGLDGKAVGMVFLLAEKCSAVLFCAESLLRHMRLSQSAVLFWSQQFRNTSLWQQELSWSTSLDETEVVSSLNKTFRLPRNTPIFYFFIKITLISQLKQRNHCLPVSWCW